MCPRAMSYRPRTVDRLLDKLFPHVPAIALDGPKAVGKSTTALQRTKSMLNLDNERQRQTATADPDAALRRDPPVFIDEWQKAPAIWDAVRHPVAPDPTGGRFLLAGSATPAQGATAHSGAGRVGRLRLRPMTLTERGFSPSVTLGHLLKGGAQHRARRVSPPRWCGRASLGRRSVRHPDVSAVEATGEIHLGQQPVGLLPGGR